MNVGAWVHLGFDSGSSPELVAIDSQSGYFTVTLDRDLGDQVGVVPTTAPNSNLILGAATVVGPVLTVQWSTNRPPLAPIDGKGAFDPKPPIVMCARAASTEVPPPPPVMGGRARPV